MVGKIEEQHNVLGRILEIIEPITDFVTLIFLEIEYMVKVKESPMNIESITDTNNM